MTRETLISVVTNAKKEDCNVYVHLEFENHTKHLDHANHYNQIIKPNC